MGKHFNDKIKELMRLSGHTQVSLAKELNTTRQQVNRWLQNDKSVPKSNILTKLASLFNVSVDYLLEDDEADAGKFTANNNIQSTITQIDNSNANLNNNADFSQNESELIKIFRTLSFRSQIKVITYAYSVKDQERE